MPERLRIHWSNTTPDPELTESLELLTHTRLPPGWTRHTSSHRTWVACSEQAGGLYFKAYLPRSRLDRLKTLLGGRARRACKIGEALHTAGFLTSETVCWGRRSNLLFLVTRAVRGESMTEYIRRAWQPPLRGAALQAKRDLLTRLGDSLGRLHMAGIHHGDLRLQNVLLTDGGFSFIDNDHSHRYAWLSLSAIETNLFHLSLQPLDRVSRSDRLRVLYAYHKAYPRLGLRQLLRIARRSHIRAMARMK